MIIVVNFLSNDWTLKYSSVQIRATRCVRPDVFGSVDFFLRGLGPVSRWRRLISDACPRRFYELHVYVCAEAAVRTLSALRASCRQMSCSLMSFDATRCCSAVASVSDPLRPSNVHALFLFHLSRRLIFILCFFTPLSGLISSWRHPRAAMCYICATVTFRTGLLVFFL